MTSAYTTRRRAIGVVAGSAIFIPALAGCAAGTPEADSSGGQPLIVGTTDKVTFIDSTST